MRFGDTPGRAARGVVLFDAAGAAAAVREALVGGGVVALLIDQAPRSWLARSQVCGIFVASAGFACNSALMPLRTVPTTSNLSSAACPLAV